MNAKDFKEACLLTESNDMSAILSRLDNPKTIRLLHAAMGLVTEAAEFTDALKKHIFYGKELNEENLLEELGDGNWYESIALDALEREYEIVFKAIIMKLKKRYGASFSEHSALVRNLEEEEKTLSLHLAEPIIDCKETSDGEFEVIHGHKVKEN